MFYVAKSLEALGILGVGAGLVLGVQSPTLWIELYLSIIGVIVFLIGRTIEKFVRKRAAHR